MVILKCLKSATKANRFKSQSLPRALIAFESKPVADIEDAFLFSSKPFLIDSSSPRLEGQSRATHSGAIRRPTIATSTATRRGWGGGLDHLSIRSIRNERIRGRMLGFLRGFHRHRTANSQHPPPPKTVRPPPLPSCYLVLA